MKKLKIAVVGYGNVGRFAVEAVQAAEDMELVGVVRRQVNEIPQELSNIKVVDNVDKLGLVDVAILCSPTRVVEKIAIEYLKKGINTIDSFDIRSDIYNLRQNLNKIARENGKISIVSAGWDPGLDSMVRALMKATVPSGVTYTNFGPGMSMGHSVVAKSKKGVADALSMTMPLGDGIHRRVVYLQMEDGANFEEACKEIKADSYFANDETRFIQVTNIHDVVDMGHGVHIVRKGVSGKTHNQMINFDMRINNPALASQTMVAFARASMRMEPGAYTAIEVPIIKMLPGDEETIIKELV